MPLLSQDWTRAVISGAVSFKSVNSLFATNVNPDDDSKNIRNQIIQLMDAPDFSVTEDTTVLITFTFDSEGEIIVFNEDSNDRKVFNYIRKNLNHKAIANSGERDKLYSFQLKVQQ